MINHPGIKSERVLIFVFSVLFQSTFCDISTKNFCLAFRRGVSIQFVRWPRSLSQIMING